MKITLFTTDTSCQQIISVNILHVTIFGKNKITIHFPRIGIICDEEQMKFIDACIKHHVLIEVQGGMVSIIPEDNNYQRVNYRFD